MTHQIHSLTGLEIAQICGAVTESEDGKGCTDQHPANDILGNRGSPGPTMGF